MTRERDDAGVGPDGRARRTGRPAAAEATLGLRVLDAVTYAVGLTVVAVAVAVPPGFALWGGPAGVKFGLFLVGFAYFGYASLLLWPSRPPGDAGRDPPSDDPDEASEPGGRPPDAGREGGPGRESTRFERALVGLPPLDRYRIPPSARFSPGAKLMLASLTTLAVSFGMEVVLGVGTAG